MFETPILLIIFNRPDTTRRVFEVIRQQKPKYLFVAADGPRLDHPGDLEKCTAARNEIKVNWDCELRTLYRSENRGCGLGPSGAISWFFENVEQGIIIEDDCIPHSDFFPFCTELLYRYKNEDRIFFIGGTNFQKNKIRGKESYYFSAGNQGTWGWASWSRAWKDFNYNLDNISEDDFTEVIRYYFNDKDQIKYWVEIFRNVKKDRYNESCWDYQFYFSGWKNYRMAVIPNKNLVSNIGYGYDATHTISSKNNLLNKKVFPILPIIHPDKIVLNKSADLYLHRNFINPRNFELKSLIRYFHKFKDLIYRTFSNKRIDN